MFVNKQLPFGARGAWGIMSTWRWPRYGAFVAVGEVFCFFSLGMFPGDPRNPNPFHFRGSLESQTTGPQTIKPGWHKYAMFDLKDQLFRCFGIWVGLVYELAFAVLVGTTFAHSCQFVLLILILRSHPGPPGRYPGPFTNSFWRNFFLWGFAEVWGIFPGYMGLIICSSISSARL